MSEPEKPPTMPDDKLDTVKPKRRQYVAATYSCEDHIVVPKEIFNLRS